MKGISFLLTIISLCLLTMNTQAQETAQGVLCFVYADGLSIERIELSGDPMKPTYTLYDMMGEQELKGTGDMKSGFKVSDTDSKIASFSMSSLDDNEREGMYLAALTKDGKEEKYKLAIKAIDKSTGNAIYLIAGNIDRPKQAFLLDHQEKLMFTEPSIESRFVLAMMMKEFSKRFLVHEYDVLYEKEGEGFYVTINTKKTKEERTNYVTGTIIVERNGSQTTYEIPKTFMGM